VKYPIKFQGETQQSTKKKMSAIQLLDNIIEELRVAVAIPETTLPLPEERAEEHHSQLINVNKAKEKSKKDKNSKDKNAGDAKENDATQEKTKDSSGGNANANANAELTLNSIDLRVGVILNVSKHPTADKLYCEEIDVGEEKPRAIASGLVPYYTLEQMQGRRLIVICNLKPKSLVGFKSNGMVLCASQTNADGTHSVEFVDPPTDAQPGDRIIGEGIAIEPPLTASKCDKTKAFEVISAHLNVDGNVCMIVWYICAYTNIYILIPMY
jgi:aminoacyl tRNA synthase complex-interacting multifunctional protein 1